MCGIIEDWPARLEFYKDAKSANEDSIIRKILFTDVEYVRYIKKPQKPEIITIGMQEGNESLSFYADSHSSTMKWYRFCGLLFTIPRYAIPEIPKENVALQQAIDQYRYSHKYVAGIAMYSYLYNYSLVKVQVI